MVRYKLTMGPFAQLDNRVFYEYELLDEKIDIESTPQGKVIVLGTYTTAAEANGRRADLAKKTGFDVNVEVTYTKAPPSTNEKTVVPTVKSGYESVDWPVKHVDTETYTRFAQLHTSTRVQHTPKGMMIVLNNFADQPQAEAVRQKALPQLPAKAKATVKDPTGLEVD